MVGYMPVTLRVSHPFPWWQNPKARRIVKKLSCSLGSERSLRVHQSDVLPILGGQGPITYKARLLPLGLTYRHCELLRVLVTLCCKSCSYSVVMVAPTHSQSSLFISSRGFESMGPLVSCHCTVICSMPNCVLCLVRKARKLTIWLLIF